MSANPAMPMARELWRTPGCSDLCREITTVYHHAPSHEWYGTAIVAAPAPIPVREVIVEPAREAQIVRTGGLAIDPLTRTLTVDGAMVSATKTEWRLLATLASHFGCNVPYEALIPATLPGRIDSDGARHNLGVISNRLRAKLGRHRALLHTQIGAGLALLAAPVEVQS